MRIVLHLADDPGRVTQLNPGFLLGAAGVFVLMITAIWAPSDLHIRLRSSHARRSPATGVHVTGLARIATGIGGRKVRLAGALILLGAAAAFTLCVTTYVPVQIPVLPRDQSVRYWPAAAAAAAFVTLAGVMPLALAVRVRRHSLAEPVRGDEGGQHRPTSAPQALQFQSVPAPVAVITAVASCTLFVGAVIAGLPLWGVALATLIPWLPLFVVEAIWKYEHYGVYAFLLVLTVLQVGHVGEHAAQVTQLLLSGGDLSRSHGVFGQLDFEAVHFVWDSGVWLSLGFVAYKFSGNRWLWVSFAFASVHEVEHVYLYWLVMAHKDFYMQGGLAGIMGRGGVIGSPLHRPYLHFMYNLLVVTPLVMALLDQTNAATQRGAARHLHSPAMSLASHGTD